MKEMASLTQRPVYGLQCTVDAPNTSVSEMAAYYVKVRKNVNVFWFVYIYLSYFISKLLIL